MKGTTSVPKRDSFLGKVKTSSPPGEEKRKCVRFDFCGNLNFQVIVAQNEEISLSKTIYPGEILDLSESGILLESSQEVSEGVLLSMNLPLEKSGRLEGVLGLVKRVEENAGKFLIGIEFCKTKKLKEFFCGKKFTPTTQDLKSFPEKIKETLEKYQIKEPSLSKK
jgi:hypothetical protein